MFFLRCFFFHPGIPACTSRPAPIDIGISGYREEHKIINNSNRHLLRQCCQTDIGGILTDLIVAEMIEVRNARKSKESGDIGQRSVGVLDVEKHLAALERHEPLLGSGVKRLDEMTREGFGGIVTAEDGKLIHRFHILVVLEYQIDEIAVLDSVFLHPDGCQLFHLPVIQLFAPAICKMQHKPSDAFKYFFRIKMLDF